MKQDQKLPAKRGQPTSYKPEYAEMLIEHMRKGDSFETFGVEIEPMVCVDTLLEWCKVHPEFSLAKKIGRSASLKWWSALGKGMAAGKIQGNPAVWIFTMKNRFSWTDSKALDDKISAVKRLVIQMGDDE